LTEFHKRRWPFLHHSRETMVSAIENLDLDKGEMAFTT